MALYCETHDLAVLTSGKDSDRLAIDGHFSGLLGGIIVELNVGKHLTDSGFLLLGLGLCDRLFCGCIDSCECSSGHDGDDAKREHHVYECRFHAATLPSPNLRGLT